EIWLRATVCEWADSRYAAVSPHANPVVGGAGGFGPAAVAGAGDKQHVVAGRIVVVILIHADATSEKRKTLVNDFCSNWLFRRDYVGREITGFKVVDLEHCARYASRAEEQVGHLICMTGLGAQRIREIRGTAVGGHPGEPALHFTDSI